MLWGVARRLGGRARGVERRDAHLGRVREHARDRVDRVGRRARAEDLAPRVRADLRELELGVVGVHLLDLLTRGRTEHL